MTRYILKDGYIIAINDPVGRWNIQPKFLDELDRPKERKDKK